MFTQPVMIYLHQVKPFFLNLKFVKPTEYKWFDKITTFGWEITLYKQVKCLLEQLHIAVLKLV